MVGLLLGIAVGEIIDGGDDKFVPAAAILGPFGIVVGSACGLVIWLVRLWGARAPLALPAAVGAIWGIDVCASFVIAGDAPNGWLLLGAPAAALGALAAASIAVLAQRYARANADTTRKDANGDVGFQR